jgi:hypothetical protein
MIVNNLNRKSGLFSWASAGSSVFPIFEDVHRASSVLIDEFYAAASFKGHVAGLASGTQLLFEGFAEFDVTLGRVWRNIAVLEEAQDPVDPSEVLHGLALFCALRGGAMSSRVYRPLGRFGL